MIKIILNVGPNGELGYEGKTIYKDPLDYQLFKLLTSVQGSTLIAGRHTAESMRNVPENGRRLIYLSSSRKDNIGKWDQWSSMCGSELLKFLNMYQDLPGDIFLIGGASLLENWAHFADEAIIMHNPTFNYSPCDTFWNPEKQFQKEDKLFQYGKLECYKWVKR